MEIFWASLVVVVVVFLVFVFYKIVVTARRKAFSLDFLGRKALAVEAFGAGKEGFVRFHGEYWVASSTKPVRAMQNVKIVSREGLKLIVEPLEQ